MEDRVKCVDCSEAAQKACRCGKEVKFYCEEHYDNHRTREGNHYMLSIEQGKKESLRNIANNLSKSIISMNRLMHDIDHAHRASAEDIEDLFASIISPYENLALELGEKIRKIDDYKQNFTKEAEKFLTDFETSGVPSILLNNQDFREIDILGLTQKSLLLTQDHIHEIPQDSINTFI
jgi:hypothetical protein